MSIPDNDLFELRVLNGLHQGAALPLIGDQWAIGADDALDLALHDAGIERLHCQLQRNGDQWCIDAAEGRPVDIEGHPLAELQPNAQFALGSVWLYLAAAEAPWPNFPVSSAAITENSTQPAEQPSSYTGSPRGTLCGRGVCITVGVLLGVVGSAWSLNGTTLTPSVKKAEEAAPAQVQDPRTPVDAQAAARLLKTMLSERMLTAVSLEHTADGLALSGTLKDESMLVYERMLQSFHKDHRVDFNLDNRVINGNRGLPFAITQIIGGTHGHLVMADGRRMYIGDRIDGLRLVQIDNGRIRFDGAQRLEVSW